MLDILLMAGAISWLTTALVIKDGPFGIFKKLRSFSYHLLNTNSPLKCFHCTSFWVGLIIISAFVAADNESRSVIQFFGVLGIAQGIRGMSGEWS